MSLTMIPQAWELALDALLETTRHIQSCLRCRRVFAAAFEAVENGPNRFEEFRPWGLVNLILPELRRCRTWPKEI